MDIPRAWLSLSWVLTRNQSLGWSHSDHKTTRNRASRDRGQGHIPPNGKRKIIDSKVPAGMGCVSYIPRRVKKPWKMEEKTWCYDDGQHVFKWMGFLTQVWLWMNATKACHGVYVYMYFQFEDASSSWRLSWNFMFLTFSLFVWLCALFLFVSSILIFDMLSCLIVCVGDIRC